MSNSISFVGRVGKDAETRQAGSGTVTSFSLATDVGFGERKQTLWFDCSLWGKHGESMQQHITKGKQLFVSGEISTREYNDKTYLQLNCNNVDFVGGGQQQDAQNTATVLDETDVPF